MNWNSKQSYTIPEIVEKSYQDPLRFCLELKAELDNLSDTPTISFPYEIYNFYYDMLVRNRKNNNPALIWYDDRLSRKEIGYPELMKLVDKKAVFLRKTGVLPGQSVCIISHICENLLVNLLAVLKTCAVPAIISPEGKKIINRRLSILKPDFVITSYPSSWFLSPWNERIIDDNWTDGEHLPDSNLQDAYNSGEIAIKGFDPACNSPMSIFSMSSDLSYLSALRDGRLILDIKPGDILAMPGYHLNTIIPSVIYAVLLNGGTYFHIEPDVIEDEPDLIENIEITHIGLSGKLRDILTDKRAGFNKRLRHWFTDPAEAMEIQKWQDFIKSSKLHKVSCSTLKWQVCAGGIILFSEKKKSGLRNDYYPAGLVPWSLVEPVDRESPSKTDIGLFAFQDVFSKEPVQIITDNIISYSGSEILYIDNTSIDRDGICIPEDEISNSMEELDDCIACVIVKVHSQDKYTRNQINMLFFTLSETVDKTDMTRIGISKKIENDLGPDYLPDSVEIFRYYPRLNTGKTDDKWVTAQYMSGRLLEIVGDDMYWIISKIRNYNKRIENMALASLKN